jgi:hypothetical protein
MGERRDLVLGRVRDLADRGRSEIAPFRDLVSLLLTSTVLAERHPGPHVYYAQGSRVRADIGGVGQLRVLEPLPLRDGRWLRLSISLFIDDTPEGRRLKATKSSFQYQSEPDPNTPNWIFRYDYLRDPAGRWPAAHLQVNADLRVGGVLPEIKPLARVHFPTDRVPLEAVIRLLAEDFDVPCAQPPEVWRAMLAETENFFKQIAHHPPFGPPA